jgi:Sec-independent protein translocase protein TatA
MFIILGLVILVAAVVAGVAGVLSNSGSGHALTHGFAVFGYHVTGSTGTLFLYGIVVGAIGVLGLILLLAGARRTSRRGREARRGLKQSRRETATASQARDDLIDERETARAYTASSLGTGTPSGGHHPDPGGSRWSRLHLPGHHAAPAQAPGTQPQSRDGQPASGIPADPAASADSAANGSRP